jgi:sirohydrochlorin cobaltochelatase
MLSSFKSCTCLFFFFLLSCSIAFAGESPAKGRNAIVLAAFGTSVPEALEGIVHIRDRIRQKFAKSEVRLAFTADSIRATWNERQHDQAFRAANPGVPADIYAVRSPLATIADLREEGFRTILVQPGHISLGEEYLDLVETVRALNSITTVKAKNRPFDHLVVSRPALGTMGTVHPYARDIRTVAKALAADVQTARARDAALLYMGHGNEFFPSGGSYLELVEVMNTLYPETKSYLAVVEGFPGLEMVLRQMKKDGVQKVVLKPFMTVAGDHAVNDMAGDSPESMHSILTAQGFEVTTVIEGLGVQDGFADVYAAYLAETARDHGIDLH